MAPVGPFSGGEKARLVLALLVYQKPAVLLLDEPTNHLDLEMRLALTMALQDFEGALIVVSHDRHLLRTVADDLWLVSDGQAKIFDGDLDDYKQWLMAKDRPLKIDIDTVPSNSKKEDRRAAADARQQLQPLRNMVKKAEQQMTSLQKVIRDIEQELAEPSIYHAEAKQKLKNMLTEQASAKSQLEQVEIDWLEATDNLEQKTQQAK